MEVSMDEPVYVGQCQLVHYWPSMMVASAFVGYLVGGAVVSVGFLVPGEIVALSRLEGDLPGAGKRQHEPHHTHAARLRVTHRELGKRERAQEPTRVGHTSGVKQQQAVVGDDERPVAPLRLVDAVEDLPL